MKQAVDLLDRRLLPQPLPFSAQSMAVAASAVLAALVLATAVGAWRTRSEAHLLADLQAQQQAANRRSQELAKTVASQKADPKLAATVRSLTAERNVKRRLLGVLADSSLGNTAGFSAELVGLARERVEGLWLRGVHLAAGGRDLSLLGSAIEPALVPRFVHQLAREPVFAKSEFRSLRIDRPPDSQNHVDFDLRTNEEPKR